MFFLLSPGFLDVASCLVYHNITYNRGTIPSQYYYPGVLQLGTMRDGHRIF